MLRPGRPPKGGRLASQSYVHRAHHRSGRIVPAPHAARQTNERDSRLWLYGIDRHQRRSSLALVRGDLRARSRSAPTRGAAPSRAPRARRRRARGTALQPTGRRRSSTSAERHRLLALDGVGHLREHLRIVLADRARASAGSAAISARLRPRAGRTMASGSSSSAREPVAGHVRSSRLSASAAVRRLGGACFAIAGSARRASARYVVSLPPTIAQQAVRAAALRVVDDEVAARDRALVRARAASHGSGRTPQ